MLGNLPAHDPDAIRSLSDITESANMRHVARYIVPRKTEHLASRTKAERVPVTVHIA
jgi:hypothetical protein